MVNGGVVSFADVAVLRLHRFSEFRIIGFCLLETGRRINVGGGKDFLASKPADPRLVQLTVIPVSPGGLSLTNRLFHQPTSRHMVGVINLGGGLE